MQTLQQRVKGGLNRALSPFLYAIGFVLLLALAKLGLIPSSDQIFSWILGQFESHGLLLVGVAAFIEGLVLVNFYFPGSAVIVLGVASAKGDPARATELVTVVIAAFFVAAQVNYYGGLFGVRRLVLRLGGKRWIERAEKWYARAGGYLVAASYLHPNLGAFVAVACGNARFSWRKFLIISAISITAWNSMWGVLTYSSGRVIREAATNPYLLLTAFLVWTLVSFCWGFLKPAGSGSEDSAPTTTR